MSCTTASSGQVAKRRLTVLTRDGARLATWVSTPEGAGPDTPTVVLAHGWTLQHHVWAQVVPLLQAELPVRVVTYDQRGHGESTNAGGQRGPARVRSLGEDLMDVLDAVAPTGPLVLAGHSMGAMTVIACTGAHAERLRDRLHGVLLVGASAGDVHGVGRQQRGERALMRLIAHLPLLTVGRFVTHEGQRRLLFGDDARAEDVERTRAMVSRARLTTVGRYYAALGHHDEVDGLGTLADVPTRLMVGERDRLTPVSHARRLAELVPHAELEVLPGRGHMLVFEAPQAVADHLAALCGPMP